jgi:hypothetical protein
VVSIDLWKNNDFRIKNGVLPCLFLIGIRFPVELLLYLFHNRACQLGLMGRCNDAGVFPLVMILFRNTTEKVIP